MKFKYTAVDEKGRKQRGVLEADTEQAVVTALQAQKLLPTSIAQAGGFLQARLEAAAEEGEAPKKWYEIEIGGRDIHLVKFPRKKLQVLFTQLGIMLRAGVNLSLALEVMRDGEVNTRLRRVLREMHGDLLAGISLSQSMAKFVCFDAVTVNLVRAGEADGHLERSFEQIASVQEKQQSLQSKLTSAAIYPAILLVMIVAVLTMINAVVMPSFQTMFDQLGTNMPAITRFVMAFSRGFNRWWWLAALLIVLLVLGYRRLRAARHKFAVGVDRLKLKVPVVGTLLRQSSIARFSRILSSLIESGQDFLSALNISRSVISNEYIADGLATVADDVRVGNSVSSSMQKLTFLDPLYVSMMRAGEESGALGTTLTKMAELYEVQTDETTKRLTTMMEPAMTVLVAAIVGVVVVAIAMPMFGMFDLVGNV